MAGFRKNNHTLHRFARAFAQIAVIAIACSVWSIPAHPAIADEALLPDDADAADSVQEIDPTLMGAAPVGREPDAAQLTASIDAYLDKYFADSGIPGLADRVRVRRVEPPEKDRARLRDGKPARERPRASAVELANLRERLALESGR